MEQFTYTNKLGGTLTTSYYSDTFHLVSHSGITACEIEPITVTGYMQYGNTYITSRLGIRVIALTIGVAASSMQASYQKRRELESIFNPMLGEGVLTYTNDYHSRSISVAVSALPIPTGDGRGYLQFYNVELIANNPLWYDNNVSALKLGDFIGGLQFPFTFNTYKTFAQKGDIANITITGDVPSPISVEFRDNSLNPTLTLTNTGEFIKVNTEIADGEKLIVNTAYGNKTAIHRASDGTETSAYHLITTDSTFFSLPIGNSRLSFSGDAGTPEVYIYWRNYYLGV